MHKQDGLEHFLSVFTYSGLRFHCTTPPVSSTQHNKAFRYAVMLQCFDRHTCCLSLILLYGSVLSMSTKFFGYSICRNQKRRALNVFLSLGYQNRVDIAACFAIKIFVECMRKVWYSILRKGKHPLQSGGSHIKVCPYGRCLSCVADRIGIFIFAFSFSSGERQATLQSGYQRHTIKLMCR